MKEMLTQREQFDNLCQKYGTTPLVRSFSYLDNVDRNSVDRVALSNSRIKDFDTNRLIEFIYSTSGIKRDGNAVDQNGWIMDSYHQNPVVLWCHDRKGEPLGRSLTEWLGYDGNVQALRGIVEFLPEGENPQADRVYRYYKTGFLNAVSSSWKPLEFKMLTEREIEQSEYKIWAKTVGGVNFIKNEYQELSCCPVPADADSLKKRIQQGELRADEFTLSIPHEHIAEDGSKMGIFYVDAHEFLPESRTIVDMGTKQIKEAVPTRTAEFKTLIDGLRADGLVLNTINYSGATDRSQELDEVEALLTGWNFQRVTENDVITWTGTNPNLGFGRNVTVPSYEYRLECVVPVERSTKGVVNFDDHGKVKLVDTPFKAVDARKRLSDWAGEDVVKQRSGYAWSSDENFKLLHHDVVDGELVLNRTALLKAAQRIHRGAVDLPKEDIESIKRHLEAEFESFGSKAPWLTTLGSVYTDIHGRISKADANEAEVLKRSMEQIGRELYGDICRLYDYELEKKLDSSITVELEKGIIKTLRLFTQDDELIESILEDSLNPYLQAVQTLEDRASVEEPSSVPPLAPELTQRVDRLRTLLQAEESEGDSPGNIMDAIRKRLEDLPSRGSQDDTSIDGEGK